MAAQPEHTKLITAAARQVLKPAGLVQKGRSRIWLDDHGWCVTQVEFQPMTGRRGSALNVGVAWLWAPKDYLSFDWGYRQHGFVQFTREDQFRPAAEKLAAEALRHVETFRGHLRSAASAVQALEGDAGSEDEGWSLYHRGGLWGLSGDLGKANSLLSKLIELPTERDWEARRRAWAVQLRQAAGAADTFRQRIAAFIVEARGLNRLPAWEGSLLPG